MKTVIATFVVPGFHNWPGAPKDLDYLSARHRHEFRFRVEVEVIGPNRELEFHELKRLCVKLINASYSCGRQSREEVEFGANSCESIAENLLRQLRQHPHALPVYAVEVWEDGECGARVRA